MEDEEQEIYVIKVNNEIYGYCLHLEKTMQIVSGLKQTMIQAIVNWDRIYKWDEWTPKKSVLHHFVLESRPRNNILQYSKKEEDIMIEKIKQIHV
jgi:hypothetical protein